MEEQVARLLGRSESGSTGEAGPGWLCEGFERFPFSCAGARVLMVQWRVVSCLATGGNSLGGRGSERDEGAELSALVEAWKAGAISRESLLGSLRRGDVLPDGRSVAQEKALLYRAK
jgi:hypothetical protein